MTLPGLVYSSGIRRTLQVEFGGYNHQLAADDGQLWDMRNLTADDFPLLAVRSPRYFLPALTMPGGIYGHDQLALVDQTSFSYGGEVKGTVTAGEKTIIAMGAYLLIFPDKAYYNLKTDEFGSLEASYTSYAGQISFHDGYIFDVAADANSITTSGDAFPFRVGDAVTISGCSEHEENNKTPIIREISADGKTLIFYENIFTVGSGSYQDILIPGDRDIIVTAAFYVGTTFSFDDQSGYSVSQNTKIDLSSSGATSAIGKYYIGRAEQAETETGRVLYKIIAASYSEDKLYLTVEERRASETYSEPGAITLAREVPDMDYLCVNENRLWGCQGKTIYASKLGDPFNFNVFDGITTDSWTVEDLSEGDFTGCATYLGYPIFFKEKHITKVYGTYPSNFQLMGSATLGVKKGSAKSLAVAGEILFYQGINGVTAYQGGIPEIVSANFGNSSYSYGVAGSDGRKYYLSTQDDVSGEWRLFVFDTRYNLWHVEDDTHALGFACMDKLYCLTTDGALWTLAAAEGATAEDAIDWMMETADFYAEDLNRKWYSKIQLRLEAEAGSKFEIFAQWNSSGIWEPVASISSSIKRMYYLPIIPRRCDHFRLKMTGLGMMRLYGMTLEYASGNSLG